ncbi:MAG: hypothetical protein PHY10_02085 [Patescibacteria group bacterium]|nr:hypothetical protein [Patescibacteria group bacterium]
MANSNQRQEICIDMQDCIHENDRGECDTYAYCTKEKNIWRMGGDICESQNATCQTYTRVRDGQQFSYLNNTLDFSGCDQNNAGCKWYCDRFTKGLAANGENTWACKEPGISLRKVGTQWTDDSDPSNDLFFNNKVSLCSSTAEGCSQFIRLSNNSGVNILANGSFEIYPSTQTFPATTVDGWMAKTNSGTLHSQFINDGGLARTGNIVAGIDSARDDWGGVKLAVGSNLASFLVDNNSYLISIWVNNKDLNRSHNIHLFVSTNSGWKSLYNKIIPRNSGWQRLIYPFVYRVGDGYNFNNLSWEVANDTGAQGLVYFDDLQLEPGTSVSSYKDYGAVNQSYFKKAPDFMKCYNRYSDGTLNTSDDDLNCSNYVLACKKNEAGCEMYRPINGDPSLPAVARDADRCPAECSGYQIFKESATNFSSGVLAVNLIPSTARTCVANETGCEEFTNLDQFSQGGEGKEYYNSIRPCRKPDDGCSYFYTWVGSDTSGYQLKRYYLQKRGVIKQGEAGLGPDEFLSDFDALKLWGECNSEDDIFSNPRCKQFFDNSGNSYLRLYENTISCSNDCHPLRKTTAVTQEFCQTTTQSGVTIPGMSYSNGICTYMAIPSEGTTCNRVNVGCREYKGNAAENIRQIFLEDFESGVGDWKVAPQNALIRSSTDSIYAGGHSAQVINSNKVATTISKDVSNEITVGKEYQLSLWVKGITGDISFGITGNQVSSPINVGDVNDWRLITFSPYYISTLPTGTIEIAIQATPNLRSDVAPVTYSFVIDNILLKEAQSSLYLIKDSWTTPQVCDKNEQGQNMPGFMIGCAAYKDTENADNYFKTFSYLCSEKSVGCEAMIETHNSSNPFAQSFNDDKYTVPADSIEYLINDGKKTCAAADKGCERFGLPSLSASNQGGQITYKVTGWTDKYLKNDPDLYTQKPILCSDNGMACEEFMAKGSNTSVYFKDPGDKACEYKAKISETDEYGWYKQGTNEPCYSDSPVNGFYKIKKTTDNNYLGFAGLCPSSQSSCTKFTDPLDNKSYYYLNNSKLDKSSCQGVSQKEGCILINDTNQSAKTYSSKATYNKSKDKQYAAVGPINCEVQADCSNPENLETDFCKYCKICVNGTNTGGSCLNDGGCPGGFCQQILNNDSNTIVKVQRDRTCGEWLSCAGGQMVWDKSANEYKNQCTSLIRCQGLVGSGDEERCSNFILDTPQQLTESLYKSRNVSWADMDYSGYSLYEFYPVDTLTPYNYGTSDQPDYKLTYKDNIQDHGVNNLTCSSTQSCPTGMDCQTGHCVIPKTCQAYPEQDSPFISANQIGDYYSKVNFCEDANGDGCQCFYQKAEYGNKLATKYFNLDTDLTAKKVCTQGDPGMLGKLCDNLDKCGPDPEDGQPDVRRCEEPSNIIKNYGQRDFCLEPDLTKLDKVNACLTWWPANGSIGDSDINNMFQSAGYFPSTSRQWYCVGNTTTPSSLSGVGFFPDQQDAVNTCGHGYINRNPYYYSRNPDQYKGFKLTSGSYTWTWPVTNNQSFGSQAFTYWHTGIQNITLGMISGVSATVCGDFGGTNTKCGACGDIGGGSGGVKPLTWDSVSNCFVYQQAARPQDSTPSGATPEEFIFKVCFNGSSVDSRLIKAELNLNNAGNTFGDALWGLIEDVGFDFKSGCSTIARIASNGDTKAYTNKINSMDENKNYTGQGVDNKTDVNQCKPWGAVNYNSDKTNFINTNTAGTCWMQQVASDSIYSNRDVLENNLFAKSFEIYTYDRNTFSYVSSSGDDRTDINSNSTKAPKVAAVCFNQQNGSSSICRDGNNNPIAGLTIGNTYNLNIVREQAYYAAIKFYAWADANQMPVREIAIDWTGGSRPSIFDNNSIIAKNHKDACPTKCMRDGFCRDKNNNKVSCDSIDAIVCNNINDCPAGGVGQGPATCEITNFGDSYDACATQFWQFNHLYICTKDSDYYDPQRGACIFKPRVFVRDNWGWCSGGVYVGNTPCTSTPGISFAKEIIIYPPSTSGQQQE